MILTLKEIMKILLKGFLAHGMELMVRMERERESLSLFLISKH